MNKMKPKKRIRRDKAALEKTLRYLITSRGGKPTSVRQAARELGISSAAAGSRFTALQKQGKAKRVARGVFSPNGPTKQLQLPMTDPNVDLLESLLKEREALDTKIAQVRDVIELHKARPK